MSAGATPAAWRAARAVAAMTLVVCALALPPGSAWANDPATSLARTADNAASAVWWGDIELLEDVHADATRSTLVSPTTGDTAMQAVRRGIASIVSHPELDDAYFRELDRLASSWVAQKPESVPRRLLLVRVLLARAWHVRGQRYAGMVPPPAQGEFLRLLARANRVIAEGPAELMADPTTPIYRVMAGRAAGLRPDEAQAIVDEALARTPADALPLLLELVRNLSPRWGGDLALVQAAIERNSARVAPEQGDEIYAQLWADAVTGIDGNVFSERRADWPRVRAGYTQLVSRLSDPSYLNRLAYLACLAEDRDTLRATLAKIRSPDPDAWTGGGGLGTQNYVRCKAQAAGPP